MPASARIEVVVKDSRWFREIAFRLEDLLDALATEDLTDETERKVATLRSAIRASHVDDQPDS